MGCENHQDTREKLTEVIASAKSAHHRLDTHEIWFKERDDKIDSLEKSDATNTNEIKNLCKNIANLVTAIKWFIGIIITIIGGFAAFIMWYIENFKK